MTLLSVKYETKYYPNHNSVITTTLLPQVHIFLYMKAGRKIASSYVPRRLENKDRVIGFLPTKIVYDVIKMAEAHHTHPETSRDSPWPRRHQSPAQSARTSTSPARPRAFTAAKSWFLSHLLSHYLDLPWDQRGTTFEIFLRVYTEMQLSLRLVVEPDTVALGAELVKVEQVAKPDAAKGGGEAEEPSHRGGGEQELHDDGEEPARVVEDEEEVRTVRD
jgi:hypothetical protein